MSTESIVACAALARDIHPEIPAPHWATNRYLDDDGREVIDEQTSEIGMFDVEISRMHSITDAGVVQHADNAMVKWLSIWEAENSFDSECFTILLKDIPALIAMLQDVQSRIEQEPRLLRRKPDATAELLERDA